MNWTGKLIGGLIGLIIFGIWGAIIGVLVGNVVDRGRSSFTPARRQHIEQQFFQTSFRLLGHLAKADGRVSEAEIAGTEDLMTRMGLTAEHRRQAINEFKTGTTTGFDLDREMDQFIAICGRQPRLQQALLSYLVMLSLADGQMHQAEEHVLRQVAQRLGMPAAVFDRLLQMIQAQASFHQSRYQSGGAGVGPASPQALAMAYQVLGVDQGASDAEIRKAYRKLISENHPDKLIGQGMPEDMVRMATERSQEIRAAYELIRKSRSTKSQSS